MPAQRKLKIVFAALAVGFLVLFVLLGRSRQKQIENRRWVLRSQEVIAEVALLAASSMDGEMAARGYLLSGDTRYRDFQQGEFAEAFRHSDRLAQLVADNPDQTARVSRLRQVVQSRFEVCRGMIELRDQRDLAVVGRAFSESDAKRHMDELRLLIRTMDNEERTLLERRDAQLQTSDRTLMVGAVCFAILILALLMAAYILFRRDAARRQSLEQALMRQNAELEDANRLKSEFLANMSHELRTPLNAVIGYTGTLLMKLPGPLTADQEKQLKTIQTSSRHLLSLINDLLDLAKIESGKIDIKIELVSCRELIEQVASTLRPLAHAKNLELEARFPGNPLMAKTDRRAVSQILINLANNGIKFTEKGGVRLEPHERASDGHSLVAIDVVDTGAGIPPEDQPRLFRAFEQLGAARSKEGTGLGLYVSGRLASLIGARIEFSSELGKGSRFTVLIPKA